MVTRPVNPPKLIRSHFGPCCMRCKLEAKKYNRLFQSVLCGILYFRLCPGLRLEMKSANPEAIGLLGYDPASFWSKKDWHVSSLIAADDYKRMLPLLTSPDASSDDTPAEYRILRKDGSSCWVLGRFCSIRDTDGEMLIQGVFLDIDMKKRIELQNRQLSKQVESAKSRDALTGLWNKDAGTRLVQEYMSCKPAAEDCTLMLLDMDDFTQLNREEGTAFADAVLQEVADILCSETSSSDIQIRLGGDEFMLFIKNCGKCQATVTGPRIADKVQKILSPSAKELTISVSIGMCATEVVNEYSGLYRCAESTLKYVKENCRGQAACYLDTSNELGVMLTNLYTESHQVNEIDKENAERGKSLVSFALDLLGKAKNLDDAISLLFTRIGRAYHLDRISLLEIDPEFLSSRFTYQWARKKADMKMGQTIYISREMYESAAASYDNDGLSNACADEVFSPFCSCLSAAIWDRGSFSGLLCFETGQQDYIWTQEQRTLLLELNKIIPSFIMKARADTVSQAKTDFLSRMSHEIRTPMNAIVGMTSIAKSVAGDKKKVLECLDKLETSNQYLLNLINDILDMSRIESGKMELNTASTDFQAFIAFLDGMLRPQAEQKGISLILENGYKSEQPLITDELRLEQVLINIIGNAIKFTDTGGKILFQISQVEENGQTVTLHFSVADTGIGIADSAIEGIFNAFEQAEKSTSAKYGGTGLGLSISSRLVQMMGGTLQVRSKLGKGSEFYFTLTFPYGEMMAEKDNKKVSDPDSSGFSEKRILLVEDNELNMEIAQTLLEMNGFLVECARNGQEALDCFLERPAGYYDAILMDIRMPILDGMETAKRLRTMGRPDSRSIPIIAMTANAFDEDSRKSLESGMNGHLSKPIQIDKLLSLLHDHLS
ncbi:ATP-binding protein [Murimonas intestini]|uniref:Circadian input-output histidine kinase CikA n=1 Tax=Murimonas intestini TaxID=1337051 RepID=A0AB73T8Z2_9FIRM|nr:ATP-binding protein [Murimonas intestini]MCR1840054.1 ATP-binding protein [Murimonas intestini]MCR1866892.1 ATP-binding protein [Murimonas intestini]MCR1883725.1 ATP-binding protein [Murimonas intestini]